jgi:hypothetical protein
MAERLAFLVPAGTADISRWREPQVWVAERLAFLVPAGTADISRWREPPVGTPQ